ncbi:hypothetical protein SNEBB_003263 [Seison nebaliae]|nr:hypothetical protein SNEBB_003263 [Seison nebaliae]
MEYHLNSFTDKIIISCLLIALSIVTYLNYLEKGTFMTDEEHFGSTRPIFLTKRHVVTISSSDTFVDNVTKMKRVTTTNLSRICENLSKKIFSIKLLDESCEVSCLNSNQTLLTSDNQNLPSPQICHEEEEETLKPNIVDCLEIESEILPDNKSNRTKLNSCEEIPVNKRAKRILLRKRQYASDRTAGIMRRGSLLTVRCYHNKKFHKLICDNNRKWKTVDGISDVCDDEKEVKCQIETPEYVVVEKQSFPIKNIANIDDNVTYRCRDKVNNKTEFFGSQSLRLSVCSIPGKWKPLIKCSKKKNLCEPLSALSPNLLSEEVKRTKYPNDDSETMRAGSYRLLKCRIGFEMKGTSKNVCQENGMWDILPICQKVGNIRY